MTLVRESGRLRSAILNKRKEKKRSTANREMISRSGNETVPIAGNRSLHRI